MYRASNYKGTIFLKDATMPIFSPDRHACAPSYVKLTKQPITGGAYRPLANDEDSNACALSALSGHHGSKLYTQKSAIHAISDNASVFIPKVDAPHLPKTTDDKSIDEAINEAANNSTHSAPPSAEIQLAQANEHPLMQAIEVCKQSVHTTAKALSTAGHAVAKAAKTTGHAIHTAATAVKTAWQTFTNFKAIQLIIKFFKKAHGLWKKRMRFSYAFYAIVFTLLTSAEVIFLQWGVYSEPTYDKGDEVDQTTKILNSVAGQVTKFVSQIWLEQKYQFLLNFIGIGLIYLALVFVLNRFWIATVIFGAAMTAYGVANSIKMGLRNEPILPSDLSFVSNGNGGNLLSFIPKDQQALVNGAITVLIWFSCACLLLFVLDGRRRFIHCSWKYPSSNAKNIIGTSSRALAAILSVVLLVSYTWNLNIPGAWSYTLATNLGYKPVPWNTYEDAKSNGPATTFQSLVRVKAMDKPSGYSKKTMEEIAARYTKEANKINTSRANILTDSTVILILSESFSDPLRVPGISFDIDPIPNIRALKDVTTSGLMLSPGYGGGTANIEYQSLTGMNLANFNDQLISPYQQLVPSQKNVYTFNQIWNDACQVQCSYAFHPYLKNFYLRDSNYKKFGFKYFRTIDSKPALKYQDHIDAGYVSDASAYQNVIDQLNQSDGESQFIQLVTMQNHLPYGDYYTNNEFKEADTSTGLDENEEVQIDTYAKGISYTDQATATFLDQLNMIEQPITVIFYGDHLPGIYASAAKYKENQLTLHESDYFIWSNSSSSSAGSKLSPEESDYSSSNFFMASAAEHMDAKVTPFLALLTEVHQSVPAVSRFASTDADWGTGSTSYLDSSGQLIKKKTLSSEAKHLLEDYRLVQYDQTAGKGYLSENWFNRVP